MSNCAAGFYSNFETSECISCLAGTYSNSGASSCSANTYSEKQASQCIGCADYTITKDHLSCFVPDILGNPSAIRRVCGLLHCSRYL